MYWEIFHLQSQEHTSSHKLKHMSLDRLQDVPFTLAIEMKSTEAPEISDRIFTLFPIPSVDDVEIGRAHV